VKHKDVLIVEDESIIAHSLANKVEKFGYKVAHICSNSNEAISYAIKHDISVILMDINIKGELDGIETAEEILKHSFIPIIYITAYMDEKTIERAVNTNPSAYLSKPISTPELLASLKIALKKDDSNTQQGDVILDNEFSFDRKTKQLFHRGEFVKLRKRETQLLFLFIQRKNQIVTIDTVEYEIWRDKEPNENTRRALVSNLRTKLNHKFIKTISGIGYILEV